jgi:hypothetical protein
VKPFPLGLTNVLNDYLRKTKCDPDLTIEQLRDIDDCITASYAYGLACGLGMASAATGTSVYKTLPMDNKGNPIINSVLNTAASLEDELVEYYKEDLGL